MKTSNLTIKILVLVLILAALETFKSSFPWRISTKAKLSTKTFTNVKYVGPQNSQAKTVEQ